MAISSGMIWEVRSGGADTNGGGFNAFTTTNWLTDGAISSANTTAPVLSSATYSFVAGDAGAWVYLSAGTNSIPGWYQIASVNAGAATLTATIGTAILPGPPLANNTVGGCGTAASLTSCTFSIDYSQQAAAKVIVDGATITATVQVTTTRVVLVGYTVTKADVGNTFNVLGGTGTKRIYEIVDANVAGNYWVLDQAGGTNTQTHTGRMGGALVLPGLAGQYHVGRNRIFLEDTSGASTTTYTTTSNSQNVVGGKITLAAGASGECTGIYGYTAGNRVSRASRPIFKNGSGTNPLIYCPNNTWWAEGIILDCNDVASAYGLQSSVYGVAYKIKVVNPAFSSNYVLKATGALAYQCEVDFTSGSGYGIEAGIGIGCVAWSTSNGFSIGFGGVGTYFGCAAYSLGTAATTGFSNVQAAVNCITYNVSTGFIGTSTTVQSFYANCFAELSSSYGFDFGATTTYRLSSLVNCGGFRNGTNYRNANVLLSGFVAVSGSSGSCFTNAAAADFSLDATAGEGLLLRGVGLAGPFGPLTGTYKTDIGLCTSANATVAGAGGVGPRVSFPLGAPTTSRGV